MNKRRKARVLSLVLALFVLLSIVPGFVPGGMRAVAAQTYPTDIKIVGNATNCGVKLFQGFPYEIVMNISYIDSSGNVTDISSNVYAQLEYYNATSGSWILAYETPDPGFSVQHGNATIVINSTLSPGFVSNDYREIPQGVTVIRVTLYDPVYNVSASTDFAVLFPYTVNITVASEVPYLNGTWMYDKAIREIPFNLTVNVTYDSDAVACFGISIPSNVTVDITMPNGSVISDTLLLTSGTGEKVYANLESLITGTGSVVVRDLLNGLTAPPEYFQVYDWTINFRVVSFNYQGQPLTEPCECIPFNITGEVWAYTNLDGTPYQLGLNDTVNITLLNDTTYSVTAPMTNGSAPFEILSVQNLSAGMGYTLEAELWGYNRSTLYYFDINAWNLIADFNYTVYHYGYLDWIDSLYVGNRFYVGVPADLYFNVTYGACVNVTSTANVTILLPNGSVYLETTMPITNSQGELSISNITIMQPGNITVIITDPNYCNKTGSFTIPVVDWGLYMDVYPESLAVNASTDLTVEILEALPFDDYIHYRNATVTVELPDGTVITKNITLEGNDDVMGGSEYGYVGLATFNDLRPTMTGLARIVVTDIESGKTVVQYIEVRDWTMYISAEPETLYVNVTEDVTVNIDYVNRLEGDVNVTLELPDGTVDSQIVHFTYGHGTAIFSNVKSTLPGDAVITATDVDSGYTVSTTIPVMDWDIMVSVSPESFLILEENETHTVNVMVNATAPVNGPVNVSIDYPAAWQVITLSNGYGVATFEVNMSRPATYVQANVTVNDSVHGKVATTTYYVYSLNLIVSPAEVYEGVPTTITVTAPYSEDWNITGPMISGEGFENTTWTYSDTVLGDILLRTWMTEVTADVLDEARNLTVTITYGEFDIEVSKNITVIPWTLNISVDPTTIEAGAPWEVTINVSASEPVPSENASITFKFSKEELLPEYNITQEVPDVFEVIVVAPTNGSFTISVTLYGHEASTILYSEIPDPDELSWVYANLRVENTTVAPSEDVVIYMKYWEMPFYMPVYDAYNGSLVTASAGQSEVAFRVSSGVTWYGYLIAVPESVYEHAKILWAEGTYGPAIAEINWSEVLSPEYNSTVTKLGVYSWSISAYAGQDELIYKYTSPMYPGWVYMEPGTSSVQTNAIYTPLHDPVREPLNAWSCNTTITLVPDNITLTLLDDVDQKLLEVGSDGPEFTLQALLRIMNPKEQFDTQWEPFENCIMDITFLSDVNKTDLLNRTLSQIGEIPTEPVPYPNATIEFHQTNSVIADLLNETSITDENGTATVIVKSKATADMTPDQLAMMVGSTTVQATYDALSSNTVTVGFLGNGYLSGDITDITGKQVPGATVYLKIKVDGSWVNATDYYGEQLMTVSAEDGHYSLSGIPVYSAEGTEYMVVSKYGNMTGYAYVTVYPFATSTADVKLSGAAEATGFALYPERVANADTVYFVFNNLGTPDAFSTSQYIARTVPIDVRTKSVLADQFDFAQLTANDVLISVGGPLVNPVTAAYEDIAPVHMVVDGIITIVTPEGNFTWTPPTPWWNATEGYFIIQLFEDDSGALVVTIYGTDADSTAAGAYYFMTEVYPNIDSYNGVHYIVGFWQDTEPGADVPLPGADLGDTSGFSAGDNITIVAQG